MSVLINRPFFNYGNQLKQKGEDFSDAAQIRVEQHIKGYFWEAEFLDIVCENLTELILVWLLGIVQGQFDLFRINHSGLVRDNFDNLLENPSQSLHEIFT